MSQAMRSRVAKSLAAVTVMGIWAVTPAGPAAAAYPQGIYRGTTADGAPLSIRVETRVSIASFLMTVACPDGSTSSEEATPLATINADGTFSGQHSPNDLTPWITGLIGSIDASGSLSGTVRLYNHETSCEGTTTVSGQFVEPFLDVSVTADPAVALEQTAGTATVTGTVSCSVVAHTQISIRIEQPGVPVVFPPYPAAEVDCGPGSAAAWSATFPSGDLAPGPADAEVLANATTSAQSGQGQWLNPITLSGSTLEVGVAVEPTGLVDARTGVPTVSGTVTCNAPVAVTVSGTATQAHPAATATFTVQVACDPSDPAAWTAVVSTANRFHPGDITVDVTATATSGSDQTRASVHLRPAQAGRRTLPESPQAVGGLNP